MPNHSRLEILEGAAELRDRVAGIVLAYRGKGARLAAIATALGYETWGRGDRGMAPADRERIMRILKGLERDHLLYRDAKGLYRPFDWREYLAALKGRHDHYRLRARFLYRAAQRSERLAARAWRAVMAELERIAGEHPEVDIEKLRDET